MDRRGYYTAIALCGFFGAAAAYYFLPTGEDIAWMQYYDRKFATSSKSFDELFLGRESTREALVPKVWLDLQFANDAEAIQSVEGYVWKHPQDVEARLYLGELYVKAGRKFDYLRNLEEIYKIQPNAELLRELNFAYAELNDPKSLMGALKEMIDKEIASEEEYRTLAHLYAANGQMTLAQRVIEALLQRTPIEKVDPGTALFAIRLYLDSFEPERAFILASNLASRHQNPKQILSIAYDFMERGRFSEAELLGRLVPETLPERQDFELSLVFSKEEKRQIVSLLEERLAGKGVPEKFLGEAALFALENRRPDLFEKMVAQSSFKNVRRIDLTKIIGLLLESKETDLADALKQNLATDDTVLNLGLELAGAERRREEIVELLKTDSYNKDDIAAVGGFLYLTGDNALSRQVFDLLSSFEGLNPATIDMVTERMLAVGAGQKVAPFLSDYRVPAGADRGPYVRAQLFLLAAQGDLPELKKRLQALGLEDPELYRSLVGVAEQAGQNEVSLAVAGDLVLLEATPENMEVYALALARSGKTDEAWNVLSALEVRGRDISYPLVQVLGYGAAIDSSQTAELEKALQKFLKKSDDPRKLKNLGFFLIDKKLNQQAEPLFRILAEGRPFDDTDLQTLLYLWGETLSDEQAAWIAEQAEGAEGENLKGFAEHLLYNNRRKEALNLLKNSDWRDPAVGVVYVEALQAEGEREKIADAVELLVPQIEEVEPLMKLGRAAENLALWFPAKEAYFKALDLKPGYPPGLKGMATASFGQGRFREALCYLRSFLSTDQADFQGWYYVATILSINEHPLVARKYYWTVLRMMQDLTGLDPYSRAIEAQSYFRLRRPDKAVAIYKEILKTAPIRAPFKSDYADLLINLERYATAERVLAPEPDDGRDRMQPYEQYTVAVNDAVVRIRLLKETGRFKEAYAAANAALRAFPDEPRIYASYANLEASAGRWRRALEWLNLAWTVEPGNDNFARPFRQIVRERASNLLLGREDKFTGSNQYEQLYEAIAFHRFNSRTAAELAVRGDDLRITGVPNLQDGSTFTFDGVRFWGELRGQIDCWDGSRYDGSIYISDLTPGFGLQYYHTDAYGQGWVRLRYHRPTFDFVQTVIAYGVEDRIDLYKTFTVGPRTTLFGGAGLQRYSLKGLWDAANSYTYLGGISYRIPKTNPFAWALGDEGLMFLNYTVDAQVATHLKEIIDFAGNEVAPLFIQNRETHNLTLQIIKRFTPCLQFEGIFGGTYDRFTNGPIAPIYTLGLFYGKKGFVEARFQYIHTVSTQFATETTDRFIVQLIIPY